MNIFSSEELDILRSLPEVVNATGTTFTVTLPERIQQVLLEKWGIRVTTVPFRRAQGDTAAHVDFGSHSFQNTYLAYLTDSEGTLEIGDASYPITAGSGFVFPHGTRHGVLDTNNTSRLMLGPMSEAGLSVGTEPTTLSLRQQGPIQEVSYDQVTWNAAVWPITLYFGTTVEFLTDLTLTDANSYFICAANNIIIGSPVLNPDGSRTTITIDSILGYTGLVRNPDGYDFISIYNLQMPTIGNPSLQDGAGWIAGNSFRGSNNYIINCTSSGQIPPSGGGIVGSDAGSGGQLTIIGCLTGGDISDDGGGIAGDYAGSTGGTVHILKCASTGTIGGLGAGGIVGSDAGDLAGTVTVEQCYSYGSINERSGGIFGGNAGGNDGGTVTASYCYSTGAIELDAGGIFGYQAGSGSTASAFRCYSTGGINFATSGGIVGLPGVGGTSTVTNCYTSGVAAFNTGYIKSDSTDVGATNYSEAANGGTGFNPVNASPVLGTTFYVDLLGELFFLRNMGPSPYSLTVIEGQDLVTTYSQTVPVGIPSNPAVAPAFTYSIVDGTGATINETTGAITATAPGTYTLTVLSGSPPFFVTTTVVLTVPGDVPPPTPTAVAEPRGKGYDFSIYNDLQVGKRLVQERLQNPNIRFNSFADYHKYKMALLRR